MRIREARAPRAAARMVVALNPVEPGDVPDHCHYGCPRVSPVARVATSAIDISPRMMLSTRASAATRPRAHPPPRSTPPRSAGHGRLGGVSLEGSGVRIRQPWIPPGGATVAGSPASARNAWTAATTCAPSPTAAASRLTDPARTSPIANTPSRLVSSGRRAERLAPRRCARSPWRRARRRTATTIRVRVRTDEEEQMRDRPPRLLARWQMAPADRLQRATSTFEGARPPFATAPRRSAAAAMRSTR